jgi:UDP-N-acetylmuramate dehydrogenase
VVNFRRDEPLAPHSTFGIGGPARLFVEVRTKEEGAEVVQECLRLGERYLVIGKGSNSLFDDRGYNGVVILNRIDTVVAEPEGRYVAGAGASFALLGVRSARAGWRGLEFASGIPGSVGGAVVMNAGANGQETSDTLISVESINAQGELIVRSIGDLEFSYRTSPFQGGSEMIVEAQFQLHPCREARQRQIEIVNGRRVTQPYGEPSVGCIFRNPIGESAGRLIDCSGLKGLRVGGAEVSACHANFIVNGGGATASDVLELIRLVKERVRERTGIELCEEVRLVPYE